MAKKPNTDIFSRSIVTEQDICNKLYFDPDFNYDHIPLSDVDTYNTAINSLYLNMNHLIKIDDIDIKLEDWHYNNQQNWCMPNEYKNLDIAQWLLDQCTCDTELQRTGQELLLFAQAEQLNLLCYLKYLVDIMRKNNVIWGVGRGSSVASFVLYLIGIHKINAIKYDLPIEEFIR